MPKTGLRNMSTIEEVINKEDNATKDSVTKEVPEVHTLPREKAANRNPELRVETTRKTTEVLDSTTTTTEVVTEVLAMTMVPEKTDPTGITEKATIDLEMTMEKATKGDPVTITGERVKENRGLTTEVPVITETRKVRVVKNDSIDQNVKRDRTDTTTDLPDKTDQKGLIDQNDPIDQREKLIIVMRVNDLLVKKETDLLVKMETEPFVKTTRVVTEGTEIRKKKAITNQKDPLAEPATLETNGNWRKP